MIIILYTGELLSVTYILIHKNDRDSLIVRVHVKKIVASFRLLREKFLHRTTYIDCPLKIHLRLFS